ncbi:MAG: hypothetical protein ACTHK4_05935 [Mycobacteriales bacterium]
MHSMTEQSATQQTDLRGTLRRAHDQADALLADPDGSRLEAVVWLSGHIAAFEHAVYPAVKRAVPDGSDLVDEDREIVAPLARTLRMLERRHSGDVLAGGLSSERLSDRLSELIEQHRAVQGRIVDALEGALDDTGMKELVESYEHALAHSPTRPHPHLHSGLMFRLDALWDRILDTMDGRHVPIPRVQRPRINPGRWGAYLLGHPHETPREPGATA